MKRYISVLIALIINGLCILFTVNFDKNLTPSIWFTLLFCMVAFCWSMYEAYKNRGITHIPILLSILVLCALLTFLEVPNFILITMLYTFFLLVYFVTIDNKGKYKKNL
ncbi:hypothetical protein ACQKND_16775 [Viridibacillus arvi]|uniref:hypothetical protein n=1 Tax=Viridibacillus arvi TaxID=263475 RepID=UPI003CFD3DCF